MAEFSRMAFATTRPVPTPPALEGPPSYTWYGCDLKTGNIVEEVPFVPGGPLQRVLGAYTSLQGSFAIADAAGDWESATDPGRTMLVCVRDADEYPLWAGIVISREGGSADEMNLGLVTLEGYFDRRFVKDRTSVAQTGQNIILGLAFDADSVEGIGITYSAISSAPLHDRTYTADSDQTTYSQMVELMGVDGGPEWTIDVYWKTAAHTSFEKRLTSDLSIGNNFDVGQTDVNAIFDYPGSLRSYSLLEDFTSNKGANHVEIFGDGEGATRPTGTPGRDEVALAAGWPRFEFRQTIAGATNPATLTSHADALVAWMGTGANIFTATADVSVAPKIGPDWVLGSYVGMTVYTSPRHPDGFDIIVRAIGWELDTVNGTVTPLLEEQDLGA